MDTPNPKPIPNNNKLTNLSSSDSAIHDSPVFSYLSNLSPIQPVKVAPVSLGFPGLASSPLIFTSPRINSRLSVLNRQLESSQDNDKCQKIGDDPADSTNLELGLQSPFSSNQNSCNAKLLKQVTKRSPSACIDELSGSPIGWPNPLCRMQTNDVTQSAQIGCSEEKVDGKHENRAPDNSTSLKSTNSPQEKSRIRVKVIKKESHLSSECSGIFTKLSIGHTSEICQIRTSSSEASHFERGSLRRCLFDENQKSYCADGSESLNHDENVAKIEEVAGFSSFGTETSGNTQLINPPKTNTGICVSPLTGKNSVSISKPLGIGLHLNSVVYPKTKVIITGGHQSSEKGVIVKRNSSVFVASNHSTSNADANSLSLNLADIAPISSEEIFQSNDCSIATSKPLTSDATTDQFDNPIIAQKRDDLSSDLCNKRKISSELAEGDKEFNPANPPKKRKKSSSSGDDETSKRCNCKKSKCLKLYCDCFAAGLYCGESCSCQGCSNRPEYIETVIETRQQIESRNPLAFAPKVVKLVTDSPANNKEVATLSTPSSVRHKTGCNCKKSMCLKKYCECYQSNVGCSNSCRCDGCQNVYGKREDRGFPREFITKLTESTTSEVLLDEKREMQSTSSDIVNSKSNSPNVIPVTPALQCSVQRKNGHKSRQSLGKIIPSPDTPHDMGLSDKDIGPLNLESCDNGSHSVSQVPPSSSSITRDPQSESSHLLWQSSPITPFAEPPGSKFLQLDDETPDILKDSPTCTETMKVRSPNKKRVSPPHSGGVDSSQSLRSSRKFVLKAVCSVPKFPPLTPHSTNSDSANKRGRQSLDP